MATTDDTYSPRLEQFARRQKQASENAKGLTDAVVSEMVGGVEAAAPSDDPADVESAEFDLIAGARKILRSPRAAQQEAAEQRALGRKERARQLQGERDQAKPSGAAAGLADLSPAQFKKSLASAFSGLDTDQAHWLKEIAEQAERNAWERESKGEADSYIKDPEKHFSDQLKSEQRVKTRDEFADQLSYDNYVAHLGYADGGGGGDDDGDD